MKKSNIVIYAGLTISFDNARQILDADYRPPIKRGDILNLLDEKQVDIIGIIDGVFHQTPAVSHKEILKALEENIKVVGAASMGALRASELYPYGMIGVGKIFNNYKDGLIEDDDDVAVAFDPDTLKQLSDPWINIKYNLQDAVSIGIITDNQKDELLDVAKSIYYPQRTYASMLKKADIDTNLKEDLKNFIKQKGFDLKYNDAQELLRYIKKLDK